MSTPSTVAQITAHDDKGPTVLAICSVLTAVATIFAVARVYVRGRILSRVGLDDWLIVLSMVCTVYQISGRFSELADMPNSYADTLCSA